MAAALALAARGAARTTPNPNVGCVLVNEGRVVGRGWTQPGGRPHAEAMALAEAGAAARGATAYVTLEPCAHVSERGPACANSLIAAGVARLVAALADPDVRTAGQGIARLHAAGVEVIEGIGGTAAHASMAPWLSRVERSRPFITLKIATSLDGMIARADGQSRWITGERARAHGHLERARHDAILVGRGTLEADAPLLDVRLRGLEGRSPQRLVLTSGSAPKGWTAVASPEATDRLLGVESLLVEGGAQTAAAFLRAGRVDRLLHYQAPILIGAGRSALSDLGLDDLADAHGRWQLSDSRMLGSDRLAVYDAVRED
ncbi:MAG: bifunctional diaminohydroxyphosphoribosylaminopyrimidine deaminase/5-amino-6-(5-phosphoribosylamino)uracil reductase RibD [Sphingopyxis sp.]|nr:bifunctional diaminohydroxyphosphoribosylaminopyrimidine deaminase/5-amino-6-(5-phosphoribosylamino)uracil reductase RibD [Sphingopyxis sp.]